MTDISNLGFNNSTYPKAATIGKITATDRGNVSLVDGDFKVGNLPKNALVTATFLRVVVAFDGTTPTIAFGDDSDSAKWLAATAVDSTGITVGTLNLNTQTALREDLVVALVNGGSTVGEAEVVVEYIDLDNRREMFTA